MKNAVLIMPYYGRIPNYFGMYLKSLEGKRFDVLWVSDLDVAIYPTNFKAVKMSFGELKQLIEDKLQTKIVINCGRRLCDFRPMYAKIFEDYIREYDYWGYGDCDLVYGESFNDFLVKTVGAGYDVVSMHKDYISGPTCFFRNIPRINELYRQADNWREVCEFEGPGGVCIFDECGGNFHQKLVGGEMTMSECAKIRDSFSAVLFRTPELKMYLQDEICESSLAKGEVVSMRDGHLFIGEKEIPVFHYVHAKVPRWFQVPRKTYDEVGDYRIVATGFYYGQVDWSWRVPIGLFRKIKAVFEAIHQHGVGHIFKRVCS